jgi:hypothetical protein
VLGLLWCDGTPDGVGLACEPDERSEDVSEPRLDELEGLDMPG